MATNMLGHLLILIKSKRILKEVNFRLLYNILIGLLQLYMPPGKAESLKLAPLLLKVL